MRPGTRPGQSTYLPSLTPKGPFVNVIEGMFSTIPVRALVFLGVVLAVLLQFPTAHAATKWLYRSKLVEL